MLEKLKSIFTRLSGTVQHADPPRTIRHRPSTNVIMPSSRAAEIAAQSRGRSSVLAQPAAAPLHAARDESDTSIARNLMAKARALIPGESWPNGRTSAPAAAATPRIPIPGAPAPSAVEDPGSAESDDSPGSIAISYARIIQRFPAELAELVLGEAPEDACFQCDAAHAIKQLPKGAVTVTFGELRMQAPSGLLADAPQYDEVPVPLPLGEIISRITPAKISRRTTQKQIAIPDDVTAPFQAPAQARAKAAPAPSIPASRVPAPAAPAPVRPAAAPPRAVAPAPAAVSSAPRLSVPAATAPVPPQASASRPAPAPPVASRPAPRVAAAPAPAPAPLQAQASTATGVLMVELHRVLDAWPQTVQEEINGLGLQDQVIELPMNEVEDGLRLGKLHFIWSQVRGWMPAVSRVLASSPNDTAPLELPLKVIAPLFLAQRRQPVAPPAPLTQNEEFQSIPNLFGGTAASRPQVSNAAPVASAPPVQSAPAPATVVVSKSPLPPQPAQVPRPASVVEKVPRTMADVFGVDPGANATPAEIVRRTASLPGMAGAVVCTPDGLVVAEHLASPVGGETFCALMTQLFNRVAGYAKDLRMGTVSQAGFVVDDVQYVMLQTPRIHLIAASRPKAELPLAALKIVARHLGE